MNPYMSMLIRLFIKVLQPFASSLLSHSPSDLALWTVGILALSKPFENDDGGAYFHSPTCLLTKCLTEVSVFWRKDKTAAILTFFHSFRPQSAFPHQYPSLYRLRFKPRNSSFSLIPTGASDLLKEFYLDLLMHTRSEDTQV